MMGVMLQQRKQTGGWRRFWLPLLLVLGLAWLPSAGAQEKHILNVKDADIRALIAQVASITGQNYVIDPKVKGKNVTVISSTPMTSDEIYNLFLSVLKVHGYAAVQTGSIIKIVPSITAKQEGDSLSDGVGESIAGSAPNADIIATSDGLVTRILRVDNVAAAQLVPILRPLVPQYGHLAAYPDTNVIIITDSAANIERITGIIKQIDRASDEQVDVVTLEHATAQDVVSIVSNLRSRAAPKAQGEGGGSVQLVADERTNSVLISGEVAARKRTKQLIQRLDTPLETIGNTQVVYLRYANATDMADLLNGLSGSLPTANPSGGATGQGVRPNQPTVDVNIQADEGTNALVVTAAPDEMRALQNVIRQLDIRRAQVLIEAAIVEVTGDDAEALGVQWVFRDGGDNVPAAITNFSNVGVSAGQAVGLALNDDESALASALSGVGSGATIGLGRFRDSGLSFATLIQAFSNNSRANLLSTPSIVTLDNEEAEIVVGQNVPFRTGSFTNSGSGGDNPFTTIEREDVGLTLRVTPQISEGNVVRLDIEQEVSAVLPAVAGVDSADLITSQRSIKTIALADDNQTIVLGGLIQDDITRNEGKVPLLGDLPVVGRLFRSESASTTKRNLLVFLRPTILRDESALADISNRKYERIRKAQLALGQQIGEAIFQDDLVGPELPEIGQELSQPVQFDLRWEIEDE